MKAKCVNSSPWPALLALLFCLFANTAGAEQKQRFDDFDVHYSVVTSTFISAEVASAYNIVRGKNRAFVLIAVRKLKPEGGDRPQKALLSGSTSDLMRKEPLEFTEITEQGAIYYLAPFKFYNEELRNFNVKVQPGANHPGYPLKFTKTLYIDD
ncbi:MAG: hypothetical protein ACI9WS_001547 [Paraglaciecola psychrophila]|jgi:hypothetical protein